MVTETERNGEKYYMCEACDMFYRTQELAQQCEDFCNKNKACNTELIKHAVQLKDNNGCDC